MEAGARWGCREAGIFLVIFSLKIDSSVQSTILLLKQLLQATTAGWKKGVGERGQWRWEGRDRVTEDRAEPARRGGGGGGIGVLWLCGCYSSGFQPCFFVEIN